VAEPFLVVVRDGRDRRRHREDRVGRVQAAAEADLEDRELPPEVRDPLERKQGRELEVRERDPRSLQRRAQVGDQRADGGTWDRPPAGTDALREVHQVRRRVQPAAPPRRAQHGVEHRRRRSLAVGAGDVHRGEPLLGMAAQRQRGAHALELQIPAAAPLEPLEPRDRLVVRRHYRPAARMAAARSATNAWTRAVASAGGASSMTRASALPTMTASAKPATQAACSGLCTPKPTPTGSDTAARTAATRGGTSSGSVAPAPRRPSTDTK